MTPDWIATTAFGNELFKASPALAQLRNPYAYDNQQLFDPRPSPQAPYLRTASFERSGIVPIDDPWFERVPFRGAFGEERWDLPWANYDPISTDYTVSVGKDWHVWDARAELFPQPAETMAWLRYEVPQEQFIRIELVSAEGISLGTIAEGYRGQGIYELPVRLDGVSSGVYFVRIWYSTSGRTITLPLCRVR
jgi:hypothetical protein